ncbi:MAG TPA: hypothetical protein VGS60_14025 [Actinomycetes bacterium]|nr:hypothetical protein [Actinomycetes bacterium]
MGPRAARAVGSAQTARARRARRRRAASARSRRDLCRDARGACRGAPWSAQSRREPTALPCGSRSRLMTLRRPAWRHRPLASGAVTSLIGKIGLLL